MEKGVELVEAVVVQRMIEPSRRTWHYYVMAVHAILFTLIRKGGASSGAFAIDADLGLSLMEFPV